jgi:hypothetical protein
VRGEEIVITRSSSSPKRVFAWNAVTVAIMSHQIDQSLTSLTQADATDNSRVSDGPAL